MIKMMKKFLTVLFAVFLATSVVGCADEPGEDEIGDGEINDDAPGEDELGDGEINDDNGANNGDLNEDAGLGEDAPGEDQVGDGEVIDEEQNGAEAGDNEN
jgi:hypothetical protein